MMQRSKSRRILCCAAGMAAVLLLMVGGVFWQRFLFEHAGHPAFLRYFQYLRLMWNDAKMQELLWRQMGRTLLVLAAFPLAMLLTRVLGRRRGPVRWGIPALLTAAGAVSGGWIAMQDADVNILWGMSGSGLLLGTGLCALLLTVSRTGGHGSVRQAGAAHAAALTGAALALCLGSWPSPPTAPFMMTSWLAWMEGLLMCCMLSLLLGLLWTALMPNPRREETGPAALSNRLLEENGCMQAARHG